MVRVETSPELHTQFPEAPKIEPNSFVHFIAENSVLLETHSSATYELRDEEQAWRDSPEVNQLIEDGVDHALIAGRSAGRSADPKTLRRMRQVQLEIVSIALFGTQQEKEASDKRNTPTNFLVEQIVSKEALTSLQDFGRRLDELKAGFQEIRARITKEIRESREELFDKFRDFVLSDYSSLFALQDFLSNKHYGFQRETIRPFLAALVQSEERLARENKEGIVAQASKKWINELKENPEPEFIDEFAQSPQSLKPSAVTAFMSWKQVFIRTDGSKKDVGDAQSDQDIREEIASILRLNPQPSSWPEDLGKTFASFISSKYSIALSDVRKGLEQFRRDTAPKKLMQQNLPEEQRKRVEVAPVDNSRYGKEDSKKEVPTKVTHPVGRLLQVIGRPYVIEIFSGDELMRYLSKAASDIDPSDPRMLEDLKKIFMSVRENPQGPGTTILYSAGHITVDNSRTFQTVRLRSLNPRLRLGLNLAHPQAYEVRIVFAISKDRDTPNGDKLSVIGIEGFYDHDAYLKRFG